MQTLLIGKVSIIVMDRDTFLRLTQQPSSLSKADWVAVCEEKSRFPFSAPLQLLELAAFKAVEHVAPSGRAIQRVKHYLRTPSRVEELLQEVSYVETESQPQVLSYSPSVKRPQVSGSQSDDSSIDIFKEINSYQEVSFKTAPKSVILSSFLESAVCDATSECPSEELSIEELGKKSLQTDESLCTETLAIILEKQGKLEQAIAVYEKLLSKNPEKSGTFATQIARIKSILETK